MIRLEIRHRGVMSLCAIEDQTAVVVVASYCSVSFVSRPCFCLNSNWRRVGVRREKKLSFRMENPA